MEKLIMILDTFAQYLEELWGKELFFLTPADLVFLIAMGFGIYYFIKYPLIEFFKYGVHGIEVACKPVKALYIKNKKLREAKTLCHTCKNPLHKCICKSNENVPYKKRLEKWKIHECAILAAKLTKEKETREMNKPIELKKKPAGGK